MSYPYVAVPGRKLTVTYFPTSLHELPLRAAHMRCIEASIVRSVHSTYEPHP